MKKILIVLTSVATLTWPALFFSGCVADLGDLGEDELEAFGFRLGQDPEQCNGPWVCTTWNEHEGLQVACFGSSESCQGYCELACGYNESYEDYNCDEGEAWICNVFDAEGNHQRRGCHESRDACEAACPGTCGYDETL